MGISQWRLVGVYATSFVEFSRFSCFMLFLLFMFILYDFTSLFMHNKFLRPFKVEIFLTWTSLVIVSSQIVFMHY